MSDLVELQQRLESLAQEADAIRDEIRELFEATKPVEALLHTRIVIETIIHDLYRKHVGEPGTQPQEALLQKLVKEGSFPRGKLEGYADAVRKVCNDALHRGKGSRDDMVRTLDNLLPIVEWYVQVGSNVLPSTAGPKETLVSDPLIKIERLPETPPTLFGRESELKTMDEAWENPGTTVLCLIGFAGSGKSSLVNHWLNAVLRSANVRGAERILGWSFYAGGAGMQEASADSFMDSVFQWLREEAHDKRRTPETLKQPGNPWDKGSKLAELLQEKRTLLLLDGFEVINDLAMKSLLKSLAPRNPGLCVITSRRPVEDLKTFVGGPVRELHLTRMSNAAGVRLLTSLGVHGPAREMSQAVEEYRGHPFSLRAVGNILSEYCHGNVMDRTRLAAGAKLSDVISELLKSYEAYLGVAEQELLRMLSVFRGPAPRKALHALRTEPTIEGLTDHVALLSDMDWNAVENRLIKLELVSEGRTAQDRTDRDSDEADLLDTHALVREHFSGQLQVMNRPGWIEANNRLFEYYRNQAPEMPDDFASILPLFRAVVHGCQAERYQETWDEVEWRRIRREDSGFSVVNLGGWSEDLVALTNFFERPWDRPAKQLNRVARAWLLTETAFDLRGLGRLKDAVAPMKEGLRTHKENEDWWAACDAAGNLSELLTLWGDLSGASAAARESIDLAGKAIELAKSAAEIQRAKLTLATNLATLAEVSHQQGKMEEACREFAQAEELYIANERPEVYAHTPIKCMHRARGFHFCDFLLDAKGCAPGYAEERPAAIISIDQMVEHRSYPVGLGRLIQAHAIMMRFRNGEAADLQSAQSKLQEADTVLREAGFQPYVVRVRIAMGSIQLMQGNSSEALAQLDEALEGASRGQMRLLSIDGLLEKARVLLAMNKSADARRCVETARWEARSSGYGRRDQALAELQRECAK